MYHIAKADPPIEETILDQILAASALRHKGRLGLMAAYSMKEAPAGVCSRMARASRFMRRSSSDTNRLSNRSASSIIEKPARLPISTTAVVGRR